ncbi:hypothetical protein K1719_043861 [Acacia pycnantha]|nr:hypothetical protein K1719_043861 [Acacia pycnantha]
MMTSQMQTLSPGSTLEVEKKPRGRPRGSKNKPNKETPRPPVPCVGRDVMAPYILEVPDGNDIVRAIYQFSISKNTGLCVLAASGTIFDASLRPSSAASAPGIAFRPSRHPLHVRLTAPNGHVFGGLVLGNLVSDGSVYVIAISFNRPSYYNISSHGVEQSLQNMAAAGGENGYAPSHLPGGIPMYRDNLTAGHGLWPPAITSSQPASSTHQYLT